MKEVFDAILKDVHEAGAPEAFIAGGALRDLALGGEIKDIDIFASTDNHPHEVVLKLQARGWVVTRQIQLGDYLKFQGYVQMLQSPHTAIEVQLIYKPGEFDKDAIISRFDFAAGMVAYDGQGVTLTIEAAADVGARRITLVDVPNEVEARRSARRAERFRAKYVGTDVVVDTTLGEQLFPEVFGVPFDLDEAA